MRLVNESAQLCSTLIKITLFKLFCLLSDWRKSLSSIYIEMGIIFICICLNHWHTFKLVCLPLKWHHLLISNSEGKFNFIKIHTTSKTNTVFTSFAQIMYTRPNSILEKVYFVIVFVCSGVYLSLQKPDSPTGWGCIQ